ncbi:hypothetical protein [Brevilactibacter flavus]|uniref:hypothetical protein n=1 Tax=Propioniciclava flava TaxID=2072026 RepID=UPI00101198DC
MRYTLIWEEPLPLDRVATRRRLPIRQFLRHNPILVSKVRSLQQTQGASCHPIKGHGLAPDTNTRNRLITQLRAPAERANAIIKHFKALQKVTLDPWRITQIVRSALVIATHVRGAW